MRSTNKSRSRNKNNRKSVGNVMNRVFDSAGPEGKVRGTPQQIIEKYQALARDAQLSGDRVAAENFMQHAEHYLRILGEAQRQQQEQNARREQQQSSNDQRNNRKDNSNDQADEKPAAAEADNANSLETVDVADGDSGLVDLPENVSGKPEKKAKSEAKPKRAPRPRKPKAEPKAAEGEGAEAAPKVEASDAPADDTPAQPQSA